MLRRIWQWLKSLFRRWFSPSKKLGGGTSDATTQPDAATQKPLDDADYEYLLMQLLEGVAHGWQQQRVLQFFETLGERGSPAAWAAWLRRFGDRLLASPSPNNELASRLVQLGELGCGEISTVAYEVGMQLLTRDQGQQIWEYDGADGYGSGGGLQTNQDGLVTQTITLDELSVRLQEDPQLVQLVAQQLGIETTDPQVIIEALTNQAVEVATPPENPTAALFNQSYAQIAAGDLEGAIASWERAAEIDPELHSAWYNRGVALKDLGRFEEAIASFDKSLEINPDAPESYLTYYYRGVALDSLERSEEALASYDKALELKPDYYEALYSRGIVLHKLGRTEEAIASFDKAIEIKPDESDAWHHRGVALDKLGRWEEAIASYEKAKEIIPELGES
jgi:Flp pilus assembly protein TadD